eukprot:CAMPEP_0119403912 /NCGR_PEP_ID=MMETSP1334-20130426/143626_1 /TAXON_ID=127549 /ORGANISM="Calcidiscus leptoporus, Strain RCC1130" /LENGTH=380 /DNA_ID=CAMNT_0007427863 /DNA_START=437 /DNA_END=1579 /DNA_ORIENTATION=-
MRRFPIQRIGNLMLLLPFLAVAYTPPGVLNGASRVATSLNAAAERAPAAKTAVPETLLWPPPADHSRSKQPTEFELNQGRAIDALRFDYPRLFDAKPDLSIFRPDVTLHDVSGGMRLQGVRQYERLFDALRFLRRTSMSDAELTYHIYVHGSNIRMRWSAKLLLRDPAFGIQRLDIVDGVSLYELDDKGMVRTHKLENVVLRGKEQSRPLSLVNAWPLSAVGTPELAMPCFTAIPAAADQEVASAQPQRAQPHTRRAPAPHASAMSGETPMQRAARERAEDAEKARNLAEANEPKKEEGFGALFASLRAPQPCESSYDCEAPMVCCDLLVASVCCTGGLMIPARPEPALQRQAIPIPVERDAPLGPQTPQYPGGGAGGMY